MNKTIHELNSLAQAQADDELIIYDVSEGESKKIQVQALNNPNYSTTEQKTGGTWIDGKPIYRKVLTGLNFGGDSGSWKNAGATVSGAESLIKGTVIRTQYNDILTSINVRIVPSTGVVQYYSVGTTFGGADIIILEYTKATTV